MLRLAFAFLAILGLALPATAQQRAVPESRGQLVLSYAPIVKLAQPSVVNVYASRIERRAARSSTIRSSVVSSAISRAGDRRRNPSGRASLSMPAALSSQIIMSSKA